MSNPDTIPAVPSCMMHLRILFYFSQEIEILSGMCTDQSYGSGLCRRVSHPLLRAPLGPNCPFIQGAGYTKRQKLEPDIRKMYVIPRPKVNEKPLQRIHQIQQ